MIIQSHIADLPTPTGTMRTYVHRPAGEGRYPVILFYSEIFQQTGPIERAARLMAGHGYAVLVPEVFQIDGTLGQQVNGNSGTEWLSIGVRWTP